MMYMKQIYLVAFMLLGSLSPIFGQYGNNPHPVDNRRYFGEYPDNSQYSNKTDAQRMNLKGDVRFIIEKGSQFIDAPVAYYQYDQAGRLTAFMAEDERGIEKLYDVYQFDKLGRQVGRQQVMNGGDLANFPNEDAVRELPESNIIKYEYIYGADGKSTNVIRWWRNFKYTGYFYYDTKGRLIKEKTTNNQIITYKYGNGNYPSMTTVQSSLDDKGDVYMYDNEGKNISVEGEYEGITYYKFDDKGRLIEKKTSTGSTYYTYDENDNVITEDDSSLGKSTYKYVYDSHGNWTKKIRNNKDITTRTYYYSKSPDLFPTWVSSKFVGSWGGSNNKADGSTEYLYMDLDFKNHSIKDNFANNMLGTFQYKVRLPEGQPMTLGSYYIYYVRMGGNYAVIKFKTYGPYGEEEFGCDTAYQALLTYDSQKKTMKISNIIKVVPDSGEKACVIKEQTMTSM